MNQPTVQLIGANGEPVVRMELVADLSAHGRKVYEFRIPFWGKRVRVEIPSGT